VNPNDPPTIGIFTHKVKTLADERARQLQWDCHFLGLASYMSRMSKDPSTKVGAVIARKDKTVASVGFNGFAAGMNDAPELYANRDEKYSRIVHGEINAILNAHGPVRGMTLYTTPFAPCERCAVMVIQAGIKRVVSIAPSPELIERWGDALARASGYFAEAGIKLDLLEVNLDELL
jgi:dCMP deaminase